MSVRTRSLFVWIAVGLAGLALAAGVTYAATQLSSQRIGLLAEPPSAGEELAPRGAARTTPRHASAPRDDRGAASRRNAAAGHNEHRRGSGEQDD